MPPKRAVASRHQAAEPSYARNLINGLTSPDNRSVVTAVGMFAAGVAFLHSSWSEYLLPA